MSHESTCYACWVAYLSCWVVLCTRALNRFSEDGMHVCCSSDHGASKFSMVLFLVLFSRLMRTAICSCTLMTYCLSDFPLPGLSLQEFAVLTCKVVFINRLHPAFSDCKCSSCVQLHRIRVVFCCIAFYCSAKLLIPAIHISSHIKSNLWKC